MLFLAWRDRYKNSTFVQWQWIFPLLCRCFHCSVTDKTLSRVHVTRGAGTAVIPEHMSSPPVFSGVRGTRSLVLYVCFVNRCLSFCTFSFGHCVVCPSSIYEFWLPLWYLQTLITIPDYMSSTGYLIRSRKSLPFARIWIHLRFLVGSVVLIVFCVVYFLFCVFDICIVTNVALVSTLFNLDCLFGFL